jgi:hypothetical protein
MANNKIQFKRTTISGRTPNTTNSANTSYIDAGELAVNLTDRKVYSSNGTVSFEVGSNLASLSVGSIVANGATGTSGQGLVSNGSAVFWSNNPGFTGSVGAQGPQGNIGFTGSAGATGPQGTIGFTGSTGAQGPQGTTGFTGSLGYTGSKGTTTIGNTAPTSPVNGDTWWNSETGVRYVYYADGTSNQWVQESAAGTTGFTGSAGSLGYTGSAGATGPQGPQGPIGYTGSSGGGSVGGSNAQVIFNDSGSANGSAGFTFNKTSTTLALGSNVTVNTSTIFLGNSTVNTTITSTAITSNATLATGNTTITGFANVTTRVNSAILSVGSNFIANTTQVTLASGVKLSANGGVGTAGQVLSSNGSTGSPYWATVAGGGGVTSFDGGSTGLSPYSASNGAISLGGTLNVGYGGTGTSTYPSNGQLLIGTSGGGYAVANLTAGSGVSITKGSGTITIAATGGGGGGPYIAFFQFEPSSGYYIGNGPTSPQQSPVVYWDSGLNQASLWWYYPTGGVSNNGVSINGGITVQDSTGTYTNYTSGTDFSSSISNWYGSGYVIGIYGLGVTNVTLRALMANTASQLGSPAIAPRGTNMFGSQSTIYASVSGGINSSYYSGGRPIIVTPGFSNGYYNIYFNSFSSTSDSGLSLSYLTIDNNLGTGSFTYYAGTDFSVSTASNDSNQQFTCQIYSVSNTTLSTLLDNTIIN